MVRIDRDLACWISLHSIGGVSGSSFGSTPNELNALATALPDGGRDRHDPALARPLRAEWIGWRQPQLQRNTAHIWEIGRGRQQVIGQRCVEQLRFGIIDQMVEEHAAKTLDQGTNGLAVHDGRIDRPSDILDRDVIYDFDMTGAVVDRHMHSVSTVAVGALRIGERCLDYDRLAGTASLFRQRIERDRATIGGCRAVPSETTTSSGKHFSSVAASRRTSVEQLLCRLQDRRSAHYNRTRVIGAEALLDQEVDPCRMRTWSNGTDKASPAICANTVSSPCPSAEEPTPMVTVPSSSIVMRAFSRGPAPPLSTKGTAAMP